MTTMTSVVAICLAHTVSLMLGQLCAVLDCIPPVHAGARLALRCISVTLYAVETGQQTFLASPLLQL